MKCPICNSHMINGVCPDCGMRMDYDSYQATDRYDKSIKINGKREKSTSNYNSKPNNSGAPLHTVVKELNENREVFNTKERKQKQKGKLNIQRIISIVIIIGVFGFFAFRNIGMQTLSEIFPDFYEIVSETVDTTENTVYEDMKSMWIDFYDGEVVDFDGEQCVYNSDYDILVPVDDPSEFYYYYSTYPCDEDAIFYNKDKKVFFDSKFQYVSYGDAMLGNVVILDQY